MKVDLGSRRTLYVSWGCQPRLSRCLGVCFSVLDYSEDYGVRRYKLMLLFYKWVLRISLETREGEVPA